MMATAYTLRCRRSVLVLDVTISTKRTVLSLHFSMKHSLDCRRSSCSYSYSYTGGREGGVVVDDLFHAVGAHYFCKGDDM